MTSWRCNIPKRYVLVFITHMCLIIIHSQRLSLSVAIVAMVNGTFTTVQSASNDPECEINAANISSSTPAVQEKEGELNWNQNQQVRKVFIMNLPCFISITRLRFSVHENKIYIRLLIIKIDTRSILSISISS